MNIHPQIRQAVTTCLLISSLGWMVGPARATPLDITQQPLFLLGSVDPNIMLMVDNSGSMSNIVPDAPYVASNPYLSTCSGSNLIAAGTQVEVRIVSSKPKINYGGKNYSWGTGSGNIDGLSKRCFATASQYMAKLNANSGTSPSGYLPSEYSGNFLNWYFNASNTSPVWTSQQKKPGTQSRLEIAKSASKSLIDSLGADNRVGFSTYNDSDGGSLREVVDSLTTAKRTSIKGKIDALTAGTNTPLAETLADIGRYFTTGYSGNLTLHPGQANQSDRSVSDIFNGHSIQNSTGKSLTAPVQYFCQKNFAVMLTDGRPQADQAISSYLCDYDGDSGGSCKNFDKKVGQEYESQGSDYLDDVAKALYEMDLRPDLSDPSGKVGDKSNVTTFMIGFADDQAINDPLMKDTANNGGGLFLQAKDADSLIQAFETIAATIKKDKPSASALAANSTSVEIGAVVFQAVFDSTDWSGDLIAYPVGSNGQVAVNSAYWKAASKLTDTAAANARKIYTIKAGIGVDFVWGSLATTQQTYLNAGDSKGMDRLAWIRGVHDKEARFAGGEFRNREQSILGKKSLEGTANQEQGRKLCLQNPKDTSYGGCSVVAKQEWIMGDIVNSDPVFMHANDFGYETLIATEAASYAGYKADKAAGSPLVFVGGNSGMLHAFRADTADSKSGKELFAYVPNAVYPNLSKLSALSYAHNYFVDGSPTVGDAYFDGDWHTMLVSGLGAGGNSVFALDVTEFATKPSESANPTASTMVKWEFTDADMGLTYSKPQIARLNNGVWAAIFGNGYNSTSEQAYLYVVNIKTGAIIKKIAAGAAGSNGLSTPALYDNDGDKIIDYVYAGDLQGNLWKFDLSDKTTTSAWGVAYSGEPLITARNSSGQVQPITAQPLLGTPPTVTPTPLDPGVMVYFGTGQYLQNDDISGSKALNVQSFYGIWDNGSAISETNRSALQQQTIESTGSTYRTTSTGEVEWETQRGWYMDLSVPGERVVTKALLHYGRVIFLTMIPSTEKCQPGGSSWFMQLEALSGSRTEESTFDFNNDDKFDSGDYFNSLVASGYKTGVGITKPPAIFTGTPGTYGTPENPGTSSKDYGVVTGTTGGVETVGLLGGPTTPPPGPPGGAPGGGFRRTYWLQIL
jgi:type IV pilus assembly protein PilY1